MLAPVSPADAAKVLADPDACEATITEGALPLLAVDLAPADALDCLARVSPVPWRIVVGVAPPDGTPPPAVVDVAITRRSSGMPASTAADLVEVSDLDEALGLLATAVAERPLTAASLVQLLRVRERLGMAEALVAESQTYSMLLAGREHAAWSAGFARPSAKANSQPLLLDDEGGRLVVTLNRPQARNAYDAATRDALVDTLRAMVGLEGGPVVELRGRGSSFCSGGDLAEFGTTPDPLTAHAIRTSRAPGLLLWELAERAIATVHGPCVGAGVELPAFCSHVTALADATFRLPEVSMGLIPGAGGTASLPPRIGRRRTAWLALTGVELDAATALRWGLVDELSDRRRWW